MKKEDDNALIPHDERLPPDSLPQQLLYIIGQQPEWQIHAGSVLQRQALDYKKRKHIQQQEAYAIANFVLFDGLVAQAIEQGAINLPETDEEIEKIVKEGLPRRDTHVEELSSFLEPILQQYMTRRRGASSESEAWRLGIPNDTLASTRQVLAQRRRNPDVRLAEQVKQLIVDRQKLIPQAAEGLFRFETQSRGITYTELDPKITTNIARDGKLQTTLLRSFAAASIMESEAHFDFLNVTDAQLQQLSEKVDQVPNNPDSHLQEVILFLQRYELAPEFITPQFTGLIADYRRQVIDMVKNWKADLQRKENSGEAVLPGSPRYIELKNHHLEGLALSLFSPDVDIIVSPQLAQLAEFQSIPNIFEPPTYINGQQIPNSDSLAHVIQLMEASNHSPSDPTFVRLKTAYNAWMEFKRQKTTLEERVRELEEKITQLQPTAGVIDDLQLRSTLFSSGHISSLVNRISYIKRLLAEEQKDKKIIDQVSRISGDLTENEIDDRLKLIIAESQLEDKLKAIKKSIKYNQKYLESPGWHYFLIDPDRLIRHSYSTLEDINRDLAKLENFQQQVKSGQLDIGELIISNPAKTINFLKWWQEAEIKTDEELERKERKIIRLLRKEIGILQTGRAWQLHETYGQRAQATLDWAIDTFRSLKSDLTQFQELSLLKAALEEAKQNLHTASNPPLEQALKDMTLKNIKGHINYLKMKNVDDEMVASATEDQLQRVSAVWESLRESRVSSLRVRPISNFSQYLLTLKKENQKKIKLVLQELDNPVIPWQLGEGHSIGVVIQSALTRVALIRAKQGAYNNLMSQLAEAQEYNRRVKPLVNAAEDAKEIDAAKRAISLNEDALKKASADLVKVMQDLQLVLSES